MTSNRVHRSSTELGRSFDMSPKLRAALEYLGDRLSTHRDSRFKPRRLFLLDEWLASRRSGGDSRESARHKFRSLQVCHDFDLSTLLPHVGIFYLACSQKDYGDCSISA